MTFFWENNILQIDDSKPWHLEFCDFSNTGAFEMRLSFPGSDIDDIVMIDDDGSAFKAYESGEYPYYMLDYTAEVMAEIQRRIKTERASLIDLTDVLNMIRPKWLK